MKSYHDIAGDGGSRILEQVLAQRGRIAESLAGVRQLLAVGSGKGGVGKSTLTLLLATALQLRGRRCAILDADVNGPSQARLSGVGRVPFVPGDGGLALPRNRDGLGVVSLGSAVPESDALDFDSVSTGETHTWRATREFTALGELIGAVAWGELDLLLIDLPPGAERTFQFAEFLGPSAAFVLVTLPAQLSRGIVARSLAALARAPNPILGYVENMQGYACPGCREIRPLFPDAGGIELDLPLLGQVPFDPELAAAGDQGRHALAEADRPSTRAIEALATRVLERLAAHAPKERSR